MAALAVREQCAIRADGEVLGHEAADAQAADAAETDERPDDCDCWNVEQSLPCWFCWRAGFRSQNPEEPGADDDGESNQ